MLVLKWVVFVLGRTGDGFEVLRKRVAMEAIEEGDRGLAYLQ